MLNQAQGDYYEKTGVQLFLGLSAEGMGIGIGLRGAGFGAAGAEAGNSPLVAFAAASAAQGVDTFGDYGEEDESADLILWRGGDLDRMRRVADERRKMRFELFKKKLLKKTQDEKLVAAFEEKVDEALKAMAEPTQDDQQDD